MNDRFLKRAHMYLSKMVLHVLLCKLCEKREMRNAVFSEITLF